MTQPVPPALVPVRAPDGTVGTVDATELDAAVRSGFAPLAGDELQAEQDKETIKALPGGGALAASLGIGRSLAPGVYDPALIGLAGGIYGPEGETEMRRGLRAIEAAHPTASGIGELAGMLPTGGFAGVVRGGGKAAEKLAARALPEATTTLGRIARAGLTAGAAGAAEGAVYGIGSQFDEDALGDHESTAEKLVASGLRGAFFGAGIGGVMGSGMQALTEGSTRVSGFLADRADQRASAAAEAQAAEMRPKLAESNVPVEPGEAVAPVGGAATKAVDELANNLVKRQTGQDVKAAAKLAYETEARLGQVDDALDASTRKLVAAGDAAMKVDEQILPKIAFGEGKAEQMATLVDPAKWQEGAESAIRIRNAVQEKVEWLESLADKGGSSATVSKLRTSLDAYDQKLNWSIANATKEEIARDAFMYADKLKRDIGKGAGMGLREFQRTDAQKELFSLYHEMIPALEDEGVWGAAGAAQKAVNEATTTKLQTSDAFRSSFLTNFEKVGGNAITRFDGGSIKGYLRGVLGAENDLKNEAAARWLGGLRQQMDAVEQHYALSAGEKSQFAAGRKALDEFERTLQSSRDEAAVVAKAKALKESEQGKAIGGLIGLAVDSFTRPITTAERLGAIRRAANRVDAAVKKGVAGVFDRGAAVAARIPMPREEARRIATEVSELASNPERLTDRIERTFRGLADAAPKIATSVGATATRATLYLATKAPKSATPMASATPQLVKPRVDEAELARFARRVEAVSDPMTVLEDMRRGAISREGIEAIREVYPKLFAQMQAEALEHLARATKEPSYEDRLQLGVLLGSPTDPTLVPEFIATMQQMKADAAKAQGGGGQQPSSPKGGGRRPIKIDTDSMRTESERIASR